jgi:hypothetical protein
MAADIDALNYPYIRVRSADWLKRTLLIFPHVVRMTPSWGAPADDPEVAVFAGYESRRKPLLRSADVHAGHVHQAQRELVEELRHRLEAEGPAFRRRFGRTAARRRDASSIGGNLTVWERRLSQSATFQIHAYKLFEELPEFLRDEELAWTPDSALADGPDYLEMHPQLGEAVMSTLAVACAENEGLQVVTEFPKLHGKLLGTPREKILTACLDGVKPNGQTSGRQIAEFFVYRHCNVDMLSAENIVALKSEREALADFRGKLEELAKTLPPTVFSEAHLQDRLDDLLSDMFREWERDQANLSSVARRFFGEGMFTEAGKLVQKLVEAAMKPETGQDIMKGATIGGLAGVPAGNVIVPVLTGAGIGLVIALVFRGFESWSKARDTAKKSPLRYLTELQDQGVSFSVSR